MVKQLRWLMVLLAVTLVALLAAGCGSGAKAPSKFTVIQTAFRGPVTKVCSGLTDTCVVKTQRDALIAGTNTAASDFIGGGFGGVGCKIVDVSSYQGHPDWNAAKGSICGAIFKGGEYKLDPTAGYNNSELARLKIWRAMYWYVRSTGCSHEAAQIISLAHTYGVVVVVNDLESPEAVGYSACLVPAERAAHLIPVDYTSPGTWPGGGFGIAPLWQAEYGSILHPFWQPVVAWQCTDGVYGCVTYIPGIGQDDVSIDLGITKLGVPVNPLGIFPTAKFHSPFGDLSERDLIAHYIGARKHPEKYAKFLKYVLEPRLKYAAGRLYWLSRHVWGSPTHPQWPNNGGSRYQFTVKASAGQIIKP